jgi:hypothetical protein
MEDIYEERLIVEGERLQQRTGKVGKSQTM